MLEFIGTLVILVLLVLIVVGVTASTVLYHMSKHTKHQH